MTIVGVLCGIVATIPITVGLLIALTRERARYLPDDDEYIDPAPAPAPYNVYRPAAPPQPPQMPQQPQIIVVSPPQSRLPQILTLTQTIYSHRKPVPPPRRCRNAISKSSAKTTANNQPAC